MHLNKTNFFYIHVGLKTGLNPVFKPTCIFSVYFNQAMKSDLIPPV